MRKLLTTKLAVLGLIVAAPALAAGAAATVGSPNDSGSGDEPPVVQFTTDHSTPAPDLQDEVADVEDQSDSGAADAPDKSSDDQASDDQTSDDQVSDDD